MTNMLDLFRQFPNTTVGLIIGSGLAALIVSTPFVDAAFCAIFVPLLVTFACAVRTISVWAQDAAGSVTGWAEKLSQPIGRASG